MAKRKIIKIDEGKCNGCGLCIPNCPEGAIKIIDEKAKLISDLFCDGLGACLGHCPEGAISIEEREASPYDEKEVMKNIIKQGSNVIAEHLNHLRDHNEADYYNQALEFMKKENLEIPESHKREERAHAHNFQGCPGSRIMEFKKKGNENKVRDNAPEPESQLAQWPIQIMLIPPQAPYLNGADLLVAADCVPFAYADFHEKCLKGKVLLIGCPKLDDAQFYDEKIKEMVLTNNIKSITYMHMEVPCCFGLIPIIQGAIAESKKEIPFEEITVGVNGDIL